jgi:transcriptional regulator with GAF, ATPase, and Fis domain
MELTPLSGAMESAQERSHLIEKGNQAFDLFRKVQEAMRSVPDFSKTCTAILDAVMEEIDAENCSLMLKDHRSDFLSVRAARGKGETKSVFYSNQPVIGSRFKSGEGIAGKVFQEGRAVMLDDVRNAPLFVRAEGASERLNSLICFPIRENGRVVGVFNVSHSRKGAFNEGDKWILSYISNQVGMALTFARFFMEMKKMSRPSHASAFFEIGGMTPDNGLFIYAGKKMREIKELIDRIADTDVTVLIQGESGVGKEVVARSIHLNSFRRDKPFVKVNCAALPQELLESELFGYEKGAFTGAYRQKLGKFEQANTGTIFLDEISEMSPFLQGKLLQVLQDKEFSRLGGKKDIRVSVRILAATNKQIEESVAKGQFREDLYYRLNVVNLTIPPLRERVEEIQVFIEYFLEKFSKKYQKKAPAVSDRMMNVFSRHPWMGNVRELENVIQRFVLLENEKMIMDELGGAIIQRSDEEQEKDVRNSRPWPSLREVHREAIHKAESEVILKALQMTNWNRKKASGLLNISYKALLYKIRECGIDKVFTPPEVVPPPVLGRNGPNL